MASRFCTEDGDAAMDSSVVSEHLFAFSVCKHRATKAKASARTCHQALLLRLRSLSLKHV